jgi:hypothetical protein
MLCDLRFWYAGRDRSCPPRTSGFRCRTDPARTRVTTITAGSGSFRARTPALGPPRPGRDRSAVPGWPFLPWEGLEGGPLVCLGGVQVEEGPAVVRAARGIAQIGV